MRPSPSSTQMRPRASIATAPEPGCAPSSPIPTNSNRTGQRRPGTSVPGRRSCRDRHHVSGQPRPVPDRRMLKPCMRPDTPCWKWMPTSPSTYGQGLARPARPRRPPGTFPLVGASEKQGPGTKFSGFVPGPRDKTHVPGLVTRDQGPQTTVPGLISAPKRCLQRLGSWTSRFQRRPCLPPLTQTETATCRPRKCVRHSPVSDRHWCRRHWSK